jgi:hypothetical protein
MNIMALKIGYELKRHAPFTALGAITGIVIMVVVVWGNIPQEINYTVFHTLHPIHVVLSALVTTAMYSKYKSKFWLAILVGYTGSIGIATVSDVIIPYLGGTLLHLEMELHFPFIEKWWLLNPLAIAGIIIGYWKHITRIPHSFHVLLSTWASSFYFLAFGTAEWMPLLPFIFLFLFLAVWIPCCTSDIAYPLLFIKKARHEPKKLE